MVSVVMFSETLTVLPDPVSIVSSAVIPEASVFVHPSNQLLVLEKAPRKVVWVKKVVSVRVSEPDRAGLLEVGNGESEPSASSISASKGSEAKELFIPEAEI